LAKRLSFAELAFGWGRTWRFCTVAMTEKERKNMNIRDVLLKMIELSNDEGATESERQVARHKIKEIAKKYAIDLRDIEQQKEYQFYAYRTKHEKRLLAQIFCRVLNKMDFNVFTNPHKRGFGIEVTSKQHAEISALYAVYKRELEKEFELTYRAFVQRNEIFSTSKEQEQKELSQEEIEEIRKILRRASDIDKTIVNP
jgi:hypothetical protein